MDKFVLFREEALKAKRSRLFGTVVIVYPTSIYTLLFVVFVFLLIFVFYLTQAGYSRKETVKGYLVPEKGVANVYVRRAGIIGSLFVSEGEEVKEGDVLAKIVNSQSLSTGIELSEALSVELEVQKTALYQELNLIHDIQEKTINRIDYQLEEFKKSLESIEKTRITIEKKLDIKEQLLENNRNLYKNGYLSEIQFAEVQQDYLDTLESRDRLDKEISSMQVDISVLESEKLSSPDETKLRQVAVKRQISSINSQLVELKNQYEFIEKAPESGIVTAIQTHEGANANTGTPLLSIIPIDSPLEIELLLPTRSAGFIQVGDGINIRFDAFPYQKFGMIHGEIINIDKSLLLPDNNVIPIKVSEASYKVRARLNQNSIVAYGKEFPLKIGMLADVDIVLEERSLVDWLLEPIYSVSGRI